VDARRVDRILHNDDITDKITEELKSADLVIADLTYARPSVYYEAGYAERAETTPVIYTCRRDHLLRGASEGLCVHFDVGHRNIITWDDSSDRKFSGALSKRIALVLGERARTRTASADPRLSAVREFGDLRIGKISAGLGAMHLTGPIKSILHVAPLSLANPALSFDLGSADSHEGKCRSLHALGWQRASYSSDGFLFRGGLSDSGAGRYLQLFRNAAVEDVCSREAQTVEYRSATPIPYVEMGDLEARCRMVLPAALDSLRQLGVEPPLCAMYALCGINGLVIGKPNHSMWEDGLLMPATKDMLVVQGPMIESFDTDADSLLHPIFDEAWNVSGAGSPDWDASHKWLGL